MQRSLRGRFYPELIGSIVAAGAFVVTLIRRDWIEALLRIDPDAGSGSLEWVIVGLLFLVAAVLWTLAAYEWGRASMEPKALRMPVQ